MKTSGVNKHDRREFLGKAASLLGAALGGGTVHALLTGCESDTLKPGESSTVEVDIAAEPDLAAVDGVTLKTFSDKNGGNPIVIIRAENNVFHAYTAVCTHQACFVEPNLKDGRIYCACHESFFEVADGAVNRGPAPFGLRKFNSTFNADTNILTIGF